MIQIIANAASTYTVSFDSNGGSGSMKKQDFRIGASYVTDMSYMFCNCYALAKLDLCSFDTSRLAGADCNDGYFTKK